MIARHIAIRSSALRAIKQDAILLARLPSRQLSIRSPQPDGNKFYSEGLRKLDAGRLSTAVELFAQAASEGSADGSFHLGLAYDGLLGREAGDELPVEPDAEAAARCYMRAAEAGHEMAMLNLSFCYRNGDGVTQDVGQAWRWLCLSAEAGCDRAQFNAGVALDPLHPPYGTPGVDMVAKDAQSAVALYTKAAGNGHAKAKVNLGVALYTGTGCDKDVAAAEALWLEANEEGVPQAAFCLKNMDKSDGRMEQMFDGANGATL